MTIAHAPAPSRSGATAVISWGLVNIPVSLYTATEETRVARSEYVRAADGSFHKVGRKQIDTITGEEVARGDIAKLATSSSGELVELTDEEVEAVTGSADGTAPIVGVMSTERLLFEYCIAKHYQVRPKAEKKGGQAAEKAFALLMAALKDRDEVAVIKIVTRGSIAKFAAITAEGDLLILHYTDGVREARPMPAVELTEAELKMAGTLLDAIGDDLPDMRDETAARIQEYVDAKATGEAATAAVPEVQTPAGQSLEDLLAASIAKAV